MGKKKTVSAKKKKDKKQRSGHQAVYKGIVDITRSGMAFIIVEDLEKDILVKSKNLQSALDGDEVEVEIISHGKQMNRMEGSVTKVIKRKRQDFTGVLQLNENFGFVLPDDERVQDIYVPFHQISLAKNGDKVVVHITNWGDGTKKPEGAITAVLDRENLNDTAMKEILVEQGFPLVFSNEVMQEALHLNDIIHEAEIKIRKDCRNIFTITIDPADAKDFDDAISFRKLKNGNYEIGVHIADVSHYVLTGTALDEEAYRRATSVYLADRVVPMLPEKISNELCSLRPHEDKLCFSVIFQITPKGIIKHHWLGKTIIHSDHRFSYEDVQDIIKKNEGLYVKEIHILNEVSQRLRKERFQQGAINFSSTELRFILDENAVPVGVTLKESKEAHQLIEELMLLANKTVAIHVAKISRNNQPIPFPYRVHDQPDTEKLKVFAVFALKFGYKFDLSSPERIAVSFNKMLQLVQGKPEQQVLESLGIRTMAKAIYTTENIGHYGLGFEYYCHFTSPIRRYPDVLVHRILYQCIKEDYLVDKSLEKKCRHCSEMERKAMDAERAANKYKQVEYMQQHVGEIFKGIISGVAHFGFWVETVDTKCEGMVSLQSLQEIDDFRYSETEYALIGTRTGTRFRIGDTVNILLVSANLQKRQLDYELVQEVKPHKTNKAKTKNNH
jgi:ribonuclease R